MANPEDSLPLPALPVNHQVNWYPERSAWDEEVKRRIEGYLSPDALDESMLSVSELLEVQPMWVTGHSWQASTSATTTGGRWYERLMRRMLMGAATNKAQSGRTSGDIAMATLGGANAWVPRTKSLVGVTCTINDVTLFDGSAAARRGYVWAWRALLAQLTANAAVAANTASFVYSASAAWIRDVVAISTSQAAGVASTGGAWWRTTTVGAYFEFTFTGTDVDIVLIARAAGAGLVTFTEGATARGALDLTLASAQDTPAVHRITGLAAGTHTIRGTLTAGASLTVDSIRIPSSAPAPIVVLGEPPVIPAVDDMPGYVAEVEHLKSQLAATCAQFPSAIYVDLTRPGWDQATMLVADGKHPNDHGAAWIATQALAALADVPYSGGLGTTMDQNYPAPYVAPAGPAVPAGGVAGDYTPPITPSLPTDFVSRYRGASTSPTADGATFTPWVDEGTALVNFAGSTSPPTVRTAPFRHLEFDGVNDVMTRSPNPIPNSTTLIVAKVRSLLAGAAQILLSTVGGTHTIGKQSSGTWILNDGTVLDSGIAAVADQWVVIGCVSAGAASLITINGAAAIAGNAGSASGTFTQYRLAESTGTTFYDASIAELVVYQYAMNETQLRAAALQLKANYGL